jgi:hypothetical protein
VATLPRDGGKDSKEARRALAVSSKFGSAKIYSAFSAALLLLSSFRGAR